MNTRDWTKEEAEVISMEEYLAKRKKIREDERKHKKKGSDDREESLMPLSSTWYHRLHGRETKKTWMRCPGCACGGCLSDHQMEYHAV